ncbi:mannosyl-glycoendo-beta-N-acetylglucosaminidase family protein [Bacillus sp. 1NLA3E]|nr:mannosyl-glycoendo-beta-N-acetylglucosaminidase family protein [Bacillus sp. 1NLA3E]
MLLFSSLINKKEVNIINKVTKSMLFACFFTVLIFLNNSNVLASNVVLSPIGYIDSPSAGSTVNGIIDVRGWVLDGSGVAKVEVIVDGKFVGEAQYGSSRPDVQKVFPQYQNANSGYQYKLDTKKLSNGQHTITVKSTGNNGSTVQLQNIKFNVQNLPAMGDINSPVAGSTVSRYTNVRGWFLDGSGIVKVDVLVDGKIIGQASYGSPRPDVLNVFPQYQNSNSGYAFALDTETLSNGIHSVSVRATAMNGSTKELQGVKMNVQNLKNMPGIGDINSPVAGSTVNGITNVRGWVLNGSGVAKVDVLVDGAIVGQAQYGSSRPDVKEVFPQYQNANSGFQFELDTKKLANGQHSITVKSTGNNGSTTQLQTIKFNVQNLPAIGDINSPVANSTVNGVTNVRGWVLDGSGIVKVDVLVDGKIVGQATYGSPRPDVQNVFPQYQNSNSGYAFALDTGTLSNGIHSVTVRATGMNGSTKQLQVVNINVQNLKNMPGIGDINSPSDGSLINGTTNVRGWFLEGSGVAKVDVLVDGKIVGQATYGSPRPDVQGVFPEYQNANSGYEFKLDTKSLTNGSHSITVQATGNNGKITVLKSLMVNVQNLDHLPTMRYLDSPTAGSTVNGVTNVRGWYLDGSGVAKIDILLDGNIIGQASYGYSRPDVQNAFPEYYNGNAGFQFSFDTIQFTDGQHTLTVRETGKNGNTNSVSVNITISNGNPYLVLDLKKPANITANDIINFFNQKNHSDSPLKNYAQSFIDAQNRYGVNAQYLVAHAIWETGWGGSQLIEYKNNLYGYGAYDSCPFTCGYYFQSVPDSIFRVAYQIRVDYLNASGSYYEGPNLVGMNVHYASDQNWKNGIASLMKSMKPYDSSYYSNINELGMSSITPPNLVRDIPAGQPYPVDTIINFPSGIVAKVVNTTSLTFRSLPFVSSSTIIGTINQNTVVNVLGFNTDVSYDPASSGNYSYRWYRVNVNGQNGWLYGGYLSIENLLQVNVDGGSLNIRSSASTGSSIMTSVINGTYLKTVTINGIPLTQNGWYNVYLPNSTTTGWVSGDYIKQILN